MKGKYLAGFLAAALITASMAGCGGGSGTDASGNSAGNGENQADQSAAGNDEAGGDDAGSSADTAGGKDAGALSGREEYVCKIVCVGDATTEACEAVAEEASKITLEKYNTRIELARLSYGSFAEELNLMLSSGEKLDLFPNFAISVITAANTGQVLALDDLLAEYGQGILEIVPEADLKCDTINGSIYGVPNNKDKAEGFGLAMRTDMLEATGYDISQIKTEDDLTGLFEAVKEKYPDTYPLVSDNGQMGYLMMYKDELGGDFGILENCLDENDTEVVNLFETDSYKETVQRRYDWAQKGYIMPDAATNTQNAYDLMATGKGFSYFCNTKPGIEQEWTRKVGTDITVIELIEPYRTSTTGMNTWFIAHNSEQPERAMEVLNEMYTNPELSNLLINGLEGEHYMLDTEKGVLTYPEGVDAANTSYSSVAWVWPNELISTPWEADGADIWEQTDTFNQSAKLSTAFGFVWDNSNVINEITACNNVTAKYLNALNCGSLNPDDALPKMIKDLEDAGIDKIIQEKQTQLNAWMESGK